MKLKAVISAILLTLASVCVWAQTDALVWNPNPAKKKAAFTKANLLNFGFGFEAEGFHGYAPGLTAIWRAGSERQLFNFIAGMEVLYQNPLRSNKKFHTLSYGQFVPYGGARFNVYRHTKGSLYAQGDLSYILNFEAIYHTENAKKTELISNDTTRDSTLVRNHPAATFKIGFCNDLIDFGAYTRYDMKPSINQKFIYENPIYDYYAMGPAINERWSIGLYLIVYFAH